MEKILSMIGLAVKAGRVEIGEEPVGSAARAKKARLILTARDAAPSSQRRAASFARTGNCIILSIPADKDVLGQCIGRTSCAMLAITDIGFANAIVKKLSEIDPDSYSEASNALNIKAKRAAQRKSEQLQHEKNIKNGKKRASTPVADSSKDAPAPAREEHEMRKSHSSRPSKQNRTANRKFSREVNRQRFEGSRPVKKGKGSKNTK